MRGATTHLVLRWLLAIALTVASAAVWGQSASATDGAIAGLRDAEKKAGQLAQQRAQLQAKYAGELDAIDRLKKQRASWNRDRELRSAMSDSAETANQLGALTRQLAQQTDAVAAARRAVVGAIDAEHADGDRGTKLAALRAQLAPAKAAPKKIVLPDGEVDPLADPEDLDRQAQALRETEAQLQREAQALDGQAKDLDRVAMLRKQHERAGVLANRDDDTSSHAAPKGSTETKGASDSGAPAPTLGTGGAANGGAEPVASTPTSGGYEAEALVVLANVVDATAIDAMTRAQKSGDPAQRAEAARKTRDAVKARMDKLAKQRAAIEARSKQLRH